MNRIGALLAVTATCAVLGATPIFDSSSRTPTSETIRGAAFCPLTHISSVASDVTITSISVYNHLDTDGYLKFLIFNAATGSLLWSSPDVFFKKDPVTGYSWDSTHSWKSSGPLSFVLEGGNSYDIGAIANTSGMWPYYLDGYYTFTQNGITSSRGNANVADYGSPHITDHAGADIPLVLGGFAGGSLLVHTPEPASLGLVGLGLCALVSVKFCSRRR